MHEFGIAQGLLRTALDAAAKSDAVRVERIDLRIGALAGVVEDALTFAFEALAEGTPAEGARVVVEAVPVTCYCASCAREFTAPDCTYRCPRCQILSVDLRRGREMELVSIQVA